MAYNIWSWSVDQKMQFSITVDFSVLFHVTLLYLLNTKKLLVPCWIPVFSHSTETS